MAFRNGAKRLVLASGCPFAYSFNLGCGGEHKIVGEVQAALQLAFSWFAFHDLASSPEPPAGLFLCAEKLATACRNGSLVGARLPGARAVFPPS